MQTTSDELREDIRRINGQIAENDRQIEEAERRQRLRRKHGDSLYLRLLKLEAELAREEAVLIRPQPDGVKAGAFNV